MKKLLILLLLSLSTPAFAEAVGQIADVKGDATLTPKGGAAKAAAFKAPVSIGDIIQTKANGSVKVLFVDDTLLTLKPNSKTMISEFLFDPGKKKRQATVDVSFGKVRTVVGQFFGDDQEVKVKTPTAVAGIRGTDIGLDVTPTTTNIYVFDGTITASNVNFPDQAIALGKGNTVDVLNGVPVFEDDIVAIPPNINATREVSFDIAVNRSAAPATASTEGQSVADQVATAVTETITTESTTAVVESAPTETAAAQATTTTTPSTTETKTTAAVGGSETTSTAESTQESTSLLDVVSETTAATTEVAAGSTETTPEINPGGLTENTSSGSSTTTTTSTTSDTTTVTITFP